MSKRKQKQPTRSSRLLKTELLEDRKLMTCDTFGFELSAGVLTIDGTPYDDFITVSGDTRTPQLIVRTSVNIDGDNMDCERRFFNTDAVNEIVIRGLDGDDDLVNTTSIRDEIRGGNGDDDVRAGAAASLIFGGDGNDQLHGRGGDDEIHGDGGADYILGGLDNDSLFGDHGSDTLVGGYGDDYLDAGFQPGVEEFVWGDLEGGVAGYLDDFEFGHDHFVVHKFYGAEYGSPRDAHARDVEDYIEYIDHFFEWEPVSPIRPIGPILPS